MSGAVPPVRDHHHFVDGAEMRGPAPEHLLETTPSAVNCAQFGAYDGDPHHVKLGLGKRVSNP
ncbi:MAG: hypothetical protein NVSMB4_13110 [Acidimicrobiales bacterium]